LKFTQKYSDRTLRSIIVIISLYCFIITIIPFIKASITNRLTIDDTVKIERSLNGKDVDIVVLDVIKDGVAEKSGIQEGDIIKGINDKKIKSLIDLQDELSKISDESAPTYQIQRGNLEFNLKVPAYKYFHLLFFIFYTLGIGFLLNGFIVGISRPKEMTSQIFFLFCATASAGFLNQGGVFYYAGNSLFLMLNYFIFNIFVYPLLFHFFSIYPLKYEFKKRKIKIFSIYLYSMLLSIPAFFPEWFKFLSVENISKIFFAYIPSIFVILSFILFFRSYSKVKNSDLKKALKILIYGLGIGLLGFVYYYLVFNLLFARSGMNPVYRMPTVLVLAIPISFGYSIFRYRILDTEFFVKRGIVFAIATLITIVSYLAAVNVLETIFDYYRFRNKQIITVITIILVIFSFSYLTKLIKSFVEKRFYKSRYNYRKSLLDFSGELPYLNNMEDVCDKLKKMLSTTMGVNYVDIWIRNEEYKNKSECYSFEGKNEIFDLIFSKYSEPLLMFDANLQEFDIPSEFKNVIKKEGIVLSLPIYVKNNIIGSINIGSKPENSSYTDEDIDLLKTISSNISVVFENSRLRIEEFKKNKIEEELRIAKRIQEDLLPQKYFNFEKIEISCISHPARIIGGDFYDVIKINEENILVVIADVSGKGLPAALYMAKVQAMIRFATKLFKTPIEIITEVNRQIYQKFERKSFVTLSLGLINIKDNSVSFIRAGHNPAIFSKNGTIELLSTKGIGLGLDRNDIFVENIKEHKFTLEKDNLLIFYTDGLNEAMNRNREEFGMEKLISIIKNKKSLTTDKIKDTVINEVFKFTDGAEQNDDITLIIIKSN